MDFVTLLKSEGDVKSIALFGLGRSNTEILKMIPEDIGIVIRSDTKLDPNALPHRGRILQIFDGERACDGIEEDVIIFSPSVRRDRAALAAAKRRGVRFTSDCELFFRSTDADVFAISGSDGKSTTTKLTGLLLSDGFGSVEVCGNIGVPMLSSNRARAYAVELSSFQLMYLSARPRRAAITNITENHLNWHRDFCEYRDTKLSLLKSTDESVIFADDPILREHLITHGAFAVASVDEDFLTLKEKYRFEHAYTRESGYICRDGEPYIRVSDVKRRERHNISNLLLALGMSEGYVSRDRAVEIARHFSGLEHRCECFASYRGVDFINSSIDTSPTRCAATLESLGRPATVLIGGRTKGLSFNILTPVLKKYAVRVIAFGECRVDVEKICPSGCELISVPTLGEATEEALKCHGASECVILSPAATSYDAYADFEERGRHFKAMVLDYIKNAENAL